MPEGPSELRRDRSGGHRLPGRAREACERLVSAAAAAHRGELPARGGAINPHPGCRDLGDGQARGGREDDVACRVDNHLVSDVLVYARGIVYLHMKLGTFQTLELYVDDS